MTIQPSGLLAVVVSSLMLSRIGPRVVQAGARRQAQTLFSLSTFLLNYALFLLIGLEKHAAVIGLRFVFLFASAQLIRLLDRRPRQHLRPVGNRALAVSGVAGFR